MKTNKTSKKTEKIETVIYETLDCLCKKGKGKLEYVGDFEIDDPCVKELIANKEECETDTVELWHCERCGNSLVFSVGNDNGETKIGTVVGEGSIDRQ